MATAVASAYSDPDKEIISHYKGEVHNNLNWEFIITAIVLVITCGSRQMYVSQGLDTALKCCYENIEDTLTVPPEVCPSTLLLNVTTCFIATEILHWWNQDSALQLDGEEVNSVYLRGKNLHQIYWSAWLKICFSSLFDKLDLQVWSSLSQAHCSFLDASSSSSTLVMTLLVHVSQLIMNIKTVQEYEMKVTVWQHASNCYISK